MNEDSSGSIDILQEEIKRLKNELAQRNNNNNNNNGFAYNSGGNTSNFTGVATERIKHLEKLMQEAMQREERVHMEREVKKIITNNNSYLIFYLFVKIYRTVRKLRRNFENYVFEEKNQFNR